MDVNTQLRLTRLQHRFFEIAQVATNGDDIQGQKNRSIPHSSMPATSITIAFRMTTAECAELDRRCAELKVSRGELARAYVKRALVTDSLGHMERDARFDAEMKRLQKNHARGLAMLLQELGQQSSVEAMNAVRNALLSIGILIMVATIHVLSTKQNATGVASYYLSLTHDRYYSEGGEKPGQWFGDATARLGLSGIVRDEPFLKLLLGEKWNGSDLLKAKASKRIPGYDLTFSAPKSVSALWAIAGEDLRRAIESCQDRAIRQSLDYLQANVPLIRRGRGGCHEELAKLLVAMFDHTTARVSRSTNRVEPQLHRHCVILNVAETVDGKYQAINSRKLLNWTRTLGPMYRANLAHHLRAELGLETIRPQKSDGTPEAWFELAGIPAYLIRYWSSRRQEMLDLLQGTSEAGLTAHPTSAAAKQWANLQTRQAKSDVPPLRELHETWRREAIELGVEPQRVPELINRVTDLNDPVQVFEEGWQAGLQKLTRDQAHFTPRALIRAVAEELQATGLSGNEIANQVTSRLQHDPDIVPLQQHDREQQFTTRGVWELETKLLDDVQTLRQSKGACVSAQLVSETIDRYVTISDDQAQAVRRLLDDESGFRILAGIAGSGKSFAMNVVRETFEAAGYRVLGGALSGVAKEELEHAANIPSRTVASYLYQWEHAVPDEIHSPRQNDTPASHPRSVFGLDPKTVLIVDEAGMLGTRDMERLTYYAATNGATLILVGDDKQLQPILAGGPFRNLLASSEDPARLLENRRQQNAYDAEAVADLRLGNAEKALLNYAARDRLTVGKDQADTIKKLVADWSANGGRERPHEHQIFTHTRAEAQVVNRLCQNERLLFGGFQDAVSIRHGEQLLVTGDRVLFHKNSKEDGVRNGYRGVIRHIDRLTERVTVELDGDDSPHRKQVVISLRRFTSDDLTLAYACTTTKGQGQTNSFSYLLLGGPMTNRESSYVQATRGKHETRLFVDQASLGNDWKPLIDAVSRSQPKRMAHELGLSAEAAAKRSELPEIKLERSMNP